MVRRKFKVGRFLVAIFILLLVICLTCVGFFFYELGAVDESGQEITYVVESGSTVNGILEDLESKDLIKSAFFVKIYTKIFGAISVEAGEYKLSPSMKSTEILDVLSGGGKNTRETVTLTFKEGRNVRDLSKTLEELTDGNITKDAFIEKLKDSDYLDTLIDKYWFLTDSIKNEDIYYSLEGYLFPDTYEIFKDSTVDEVITKMLDETDRELSKYKSDIESSGYTVHELLTLASIVELESNNKADRKAISGVFTNRLNDGWALESCVSTFYAFDINMGDRDLKSSEIADCSTKYNTRCSSFTGLPVGPIGNAGIESVEATLNPEKHDYYFFQSDKNMKTYFAKDYSEHVQINNRLKSQGLWLEY